MTHRSQQGFVVFLIDSQALWKFQHVDRAVFTADSRQLALFVRPNASQSFVAHLKNANSCLACGSSPMKWFT